MGLKNASIQFQQMMDDLLQPVKHIADPYIDDILIGTQEVEGEDIYVTHDRDVRQVLELLGHWELVCDIKKCKFFVKEVEFCGHVLGGGIRKPAPGKLCAIEKWQVPRTIHELRAFLGFTNYYSIYIQDYATIVAGLQDKLKVTKEEGKKGSKKRITWNDGDQQAFEEIKNRLCSQLVLQRVNPDLPFVLRVDASQYAVGATLEQLLDERRMPTPEDVRSKKTVPIAFLSRKLTGSQKNWVPREQETYAIIVALTKWESWIGMQPVLILTDHQALQSWAQEVLDPPSGPVGRRARWHQILSRFDLTVGYIPGKENTIADILSRWAYPAGEAFRDICRHGTQMDKDEVEEIIRQEKLDERDCMAVTHSTQAEGHTQESKQLVVNPVGRGDGEKTDPPPTEFFFKHLGPPEEHARQDSGKGATSSQESGTGTPSTRSDGQETQFPEQTAVKEEDTGSVNEEDEDLGYPTPPEHKVKSEDGGSPDTSSDSGSSNGENGECTPQDLSDEEDDHISYQEVQTCDWGERYLRCPKWQVRYSETQDADCDWPKGYQIFGGRMYLKGKLCIPLSLQEPWIRESHVFAGHVGSQRLWDHLQKQYEWSDGDKAKRFAQRVTQQCETCQACQRPNTLQGPMESVPVPSKIMESVALDVFYMPKTMVDGNQFDVMVVCVDRHSGWLVAIPSRIEGLTAAKVAKAMLQHQWRPFGIPSVITTDQGSQFANTWWQTMCATLGIRHAFSQAYHHRANGRAEMAGQQLMEVLRKIHVEEKISWVEALPIALDRIHDTQGRTGLTPYQILFGRDRPLANVPYIPARECQDAMDYFQRMRKVEETVARVINQKHQKELERLNQAWRNPEPLKPGDKVWYRRPEGSGEKTDTRWIGPAVVRSREGESSYVIELDEGVLKKAPRRFLKIHKPDVWSGKSLPLFFHKRTVVDPEAELDEYLVDRVIDHRPDGKGGYEFLTLWMGHPAEEATWEPINAFFHRYNSDCVKYCMDNNVYTEVMKHLKSQPSQQ